jgi:hypothetical protein
MNILKEDLQVQKTAATVSPSQRELTPKYVIEAVAIQLGLKPSMCSYLWPHYVAMVRRLPLVPCIQCGAASDAENVLDVEGPTFLINRTRAVNREVSAAYKTARESLGSVRYEKESGLLILNGFCEACLLHIEDELPPALKLAVPQSPTTSRLHYLVLKILRQGNVDEAIRALRPLVDLPTGSTV